MTHRNPLSCLLALLLSSASLLGQSNVAESNIFPLDTRQGATITGQVVDGTPPQGPYLPLSGATVEVNGSSLTTGSDGRFELKAVLTSQADLVASATGFVSQTLPVGPAGTGDEIDLGIIALQAGDGPIVETVTLNPDGIYVEGWSLEANVDLKVNWNGTTPGSVTIYANDQLRATLSGSGPTYTTTADLDAWFDGALSRDANQLEVMAESEGGVASEPFTKTIAVIPVPSGLSAAIVPGLIELDSRGNLTISIAFPDEPIKKTLSLALLGEFGGEFAVAGEFRYRIPGGNWDLSVGGEGSAAKVILGDFDAGAGIEASGSGTATPRDGIRLDTVKLGASLSLGGSFDLAKIGLLDLMGPGISTQFNQLWWVPKWVKETVNAVSIVLELKPNLEGAANFDLYPDFEFDSAELTGKLALNAAYKPDFGAVFVYAYVGGEPRLTFQIPGDLFKEIGFRAYAGIEAALWGFSWGPKEYVFVDESYPARRLPLGVIPVEGGYLYPAAANADGGFAPMDRSWREAGGETFLLEPAAPGRRLSAEAEEALGTQSTFARMGEAASPGAIYQPATGPARRLISDPDLPAQAELQLLANVFPEGEPALAADGNELMLLYVRVTGAANPVQFTEVAWTRFDGSNWSTPAAVASDSRAQFNPQVAFDGKGDAIAIFERVKDDTYEGSDLNEYAGLMEIVWSRWDALAGTWSTPQPLTDNGFLDFQPQLAGPLTDGDLMLTWHQNASNSLSGTPTEPVDIMTARWDAATATWSTPTTLVDDLSSELSTSFAAAGDKAVFLWTADMDGDQDDYSDAELFYREWDETGGTWSATTRHTDDTSHDRNAQVIVASSGDVFTVWQNGSDVVMDVNFSGVPSIVRSGSDTLGFADFALSIGPAGNLMLIWQEMNEFGSDAHYRVYDPASSTWGLDTLLSEDTDVESAFAPTWDASGNLTIAYLNTETLTEDLSVEVEGGEVIEVEGVPQPGQVDLLVAKRAIVRDLEVVANSVSVEGLSFLPGNEVTLAATFSNSGNVALEDVVVAFFDGDPEDGGSEIHRETISGWFAASDTRDLTYIWTLPSPADAHEVFVVIDPDAAVTEFSEDNNAASLTVGGIDLEVVYRSGDVLRDGSVRIVADVANLGAPASPVSEVSLYAEDLPDAPLLTQALGQVAPDSSQTLVFELPAGSQPQGEFVYRLVADEANFNGDLATDNNEMSFALLLWIDDDNDGLPEWWETANGLSDANPNDGQQNRDGDTFTDADEYLAGTNPLDGRDFLKASEFNVVELPATGGMRNSFSWGSVNGALYDIQRSFYLSGDWETIATDVPATPPLNSIIDEIPSFDGSVFYRLIVK